MHTDTNLQEDVVPPDEGTAKSQPRFSTSENGQAAPEEIAPRLSLMQSIRKWLIHSFHRNASLREALEEVIEEHDSYATAINTEERLMLHNILAFGELKVEDVMIPRADIVAVPHDVSLTELHAAIRENRHTRMPVYRKDLDDVAGFLHIKDLVESFTSPEDFSVERILHQILVVPPSMKAVDLLLKMRLSGVHMALVVDEYGGTDGLVTLEDIFEEIVGEIQDEHDEIEAEEMLWINDRVMEADARIEIDELEEQLGLALVENRQEVDFHTLGGLLFTLLGRVPASGETVDHPQGLRMKILAADPRRIHRVRIILPPHYTQQNITS